MLFPDHLPLCDPTGEELERGLLCLKGPLVGPETLSVVQEMSNLVLETLNLVTEMLTLVREILSLVQETSKCVREMLSLVLETQNLVQMVEMVILQGTVSFPVDI